jgi:hypothetical protein
MGIGRKLQAPTSPPQDGFVRRRTNTRETMAAPKLQIPSTKHQRNTKLQISKGEREIMLELGCWSFPGAWMFELGVFSDSSACPP